MTNFCTVSFNKECFVVVLRKLLHKMKDPDKFTIPCSIGGSNFDKCLCDLGASVNLMSYFVFKKLGITDLEPTNITLHLADRSVVYLRRVIEDVLVKVDKFIISANFVSLDMENDEDVLIILGCPFLSTCDLLIEVRLGRLTLRLRDERVVFNLSYSLKQPSSFASF